MKNCPVALHEGNILPGKPEFAVRYIKVIETNMHYGIL
jgi:hypothetical protein